MENAHSGTPDSKSALARIIHQGGPNSGIISVNHRYIAYIARIRWLHFVLSGFAVYLPSHFGKSFSNHSYGYDISNDLPNCFASYSANSGFLVNYAG
jgi:hypothetical protein